MSQVFKNLFDYSGLCDNKLIQTSRQVKWQKKFIEKARKVHGDKYDYSKVVYVNALTKVKIICKMHGEFEQVPSYHLSGNGCQKCGGTKKLTIAEFIKRAKKIHGDKYDYSKVVYVNNHKKITIICSNHGEFEQRPYSHTQGQGCPKCAEISRLENSNYISGQYCIQYQEKYSGEFEPIYRSSYELKAFQMIEEDENILKWESETIVIPYELDGNINNYIVDLKIETKNGIKLIEIKPKCKLYKPKYDYLLNEWEMNQAKWNAAEEYCKERNWEFEIWTEKDLNII